MSANNEELQTGTMKDKRNQNPNALALSTPGNEYLRCSVPTGYYENSGIDVPLSNLGSASAVNVLSGQTFTSTAGLKVTGVMTNQGSVYNTINAGSSYTIPKGYHDGTGKITANALSGTASASDVRNGKTFYGNSATKQTGTMNTTKTITITVDHSWGQAQGYNEITIHGPFGSKTYNAGWPTGQSHRGMGSFSFNISV